MHFVLRPYSLTLATTPTQSARFKIPSTTRFARQLNRKICVDVWQRLNNHDVTGTRMHEAKRWIECREGSNRWGEKSNRAIVTCQTFEPWQLYRIYNQLKKELGEMKVQSGHFQSAAKVSKADYDKVVRTMQDTIAELQESHSQQQQQFATKVCTAFKFKYFKCWCSSPYSF